MFISYCTVCSHRLWQLKQTINHNLSFTSVGKVELCVLGYNENETEEYLKLTYPEFIQDGRLKVKTHYDDYKPKDGSDFACGWVKNFAHAMGTGKILFNLDADNFIDNAHMYLYYLREDQVLKNIYEPDGRSGRIGVHRSLFDRVGGYRDEGRSDDGDFLSRCTDTGASIVFMNCDLKPISNIK